MISLSNQIRAVLTVETPLDIVCDLDLLGYSVLWVKVKLVGVDDFIVFNVNAEKIATVKFDSC